MKTMSLLHKLLMIAPAACLLAQTPPAPAPPPAAPKLATPIPPGVLAPHMQAPPAAEVPPDRVVLKAGDVTLTKAQFDALIEGLPDNAKAMARGPRRKQFADFLVKAYILSEEAKRRKLDETHAYKVQSMLNDDQVLVGLLSAEVNAETKVDEAEARKYYDDHKESYEEVTARHILIRTKGAQTPVKPGAKELTDEEALAKAKDIYKRIMAGEDFAALAKADSDDSTNANNGGLLPPFSRGHMVPSFEQAAFKLKVGEVSEPVKSQFGYHIIKVDAHVTKTFEEERASIEKMLAPQKASRTLEEMTKGAFYDPEFFGLPKPGEAPKPPSPPAPPKQ